MTTTTETTTPVIEHTRTVISLAARLADNSFDFALLRESKIWESSPEGLAGMPFSEWISNKADVLMEHVKKATTIPSSFTLSKDIMKTVFGITGMVMEHRGFALFLVGRSQKVGGALTQFKSLRKKSNLKTDDVIKMFNEK